MANNSIDDDKNEKNTFYITTNAILHNNENKILLIRKKSDPFKDQLCLPGGFINYDERIEDALKREIKRTLALIIEPLEILGVYSDFNDRFNRVINVVFICLILDFLNDETSFNTEKKEKIWINVNDIGYYDFLFDHKTIINDYLKWRNYNCTFWSSKIR